MIHPIPRAFYSDIETNDWLFELISSGHIMSGAVSCASISDLTASDLAGYTRIHLFAGIGGWDLALRMAEWPDDVPVWTGSCPCFPEGTLVLTKRGYIPIESVKVGDNVLTHKGRWRSVQAIGSDEADMVLVKGQGHWGLLTTANHPFLTGSDEWTAAGSLAGKRWRTVAAVPPSQIPQIENNRGVILERGRWRATGWKDGRTVYLGRFKSYDDAVRCRERALIQGRINARGADGADATTLGFARFLGYWLGDGWTSKDTVFLCGARGDAPILSEIMTEAGLTCSPSIERTSARARCGSKSLVRWLSEHFGATASGKRIPAWVHGAPPEWRREFLRGYQEADGHREPGVERFTTISRAIAVGVRVLLNQDGRSASIAWHQTKSRAIQGRNVSTAGGFYRITAYERSRSFSFNDLHGIGYVRTVKTAGRGTVFNIAVEEDESYTADGIIVHNCQPFSTAGKNKGTDDERHLWPEMLRLIRECTPAIIFGEQVSSRAGREWLAGVRADLEALGYAVGAADLCAAGAGAPHIRQRLYWGAIRLVDSERARLEGLCRNESYRNESGRITADSARSTAETGGALPGNAWEDCRVIVGADGKARRIEPGIEPLADGISNGMVHGIADSVSDEVNSTQQARKKRIAGYGNAIVPQVAATFIRAFVESI
ncbi:DNA cytosine methyltransferase [Candidatus Macondimonas diazotrophica]|uniref:DOD-type homing endonuclease domain-containing protein n=1 Tax=Candidatus Macondimonas diazotrophica TaxID=2305248 RepID=A0A4Z0F765_9GAMM|nr:DNA cytosine methyltransferase [Candidatus Macondimonas diazotrophica]TFZ81245.1 hypothetical protein E4680_13270 [Candidatus Macondimonas diazotrophica]